MPDIGVIHEQGFLTEDQGFGFKPLKEGETDPFNTNKQQRPETPEKK